MFKYWFISLWRKKGWHQIIKIHGLCGFNWLKYFWESRRERIFKIILCFDPSNFSRQEKYYPQWSASKMFNPANEIWLIDKNKYTDAKITSKANFFWLHKMYITLSLPMLPDPLWPGEVAPDSQIYDSNRTVWYLNCMQINDMLNWIARNSTVWSFNGVLTNGICLIELLFIHSNTWNYFNVKTKENIE